MTDPTLPGIPQDAIDHAANVERARALVPHMPEFAGVADAFAEALTAAELRGWGWGREAEAKPAVRRNCHSCMFANGRECDHENPTPKVVGWAIANCDAVTLMPSPDADNRPGWAPKEGA